MNDRVRLAAREVHVWRGDRHVLRGVSMQLCGGEFLKITGPNGAGKTTLLRVLCGLLPCERGEVLFENQPLQRVRERMHAELAYLGHAHALKADLSAAENLLFLAGLRRALDADSVHAALRRVGLQQRGTLPARTFSAGQRRRLALARLLLADASIWVMDEPATNLDSAGLELVEALIEEQIDRGGSVVAAAHQRLLDGSPLLRTLELD